ncbi:hypothetical protein, partial [Alistipes putredinis]|uniref:hypothetical protein n=1 Tax=Alistipes putredinis TaxID=28117 RepID=UPI002670F804
GFKCLTFSAVNFYRSIVWLVNSFFSFAQIYHFYFNYATIFRKKSSARLKIQTGGACNAAVTGRG